MERCLILAGLFLFVLLVAVGCARSDCDQRVTKYDKFKVSNVFVDRR